MAEGDRPDPFAASRESAPRSHRIAVPDPNDIGLPRAGRSYVLPVIIALAVFALIIVVRVIWG
jgi:hypothetical protein